MNDFYGNEPRMKKLNRDKVLELIGKTDEEFNNNGASINDMEKVFREYSIPVVPHKAVAEVSKRGNL